MNREKIRDENYLGYAQYQIREYMMQKLKVKEREHACINPTYIKLDDYLKDKNMELHEYFKGKINKGLWNRITLFFKSIFKMRDKENFRT